MVNKNNISEATIILGPAGISNSKELKSPNKTELIPKSIAIMAICSGLVEKWRADAAGIINNAVSSITPTIFIEMATTNANIIINRKLERLGSSPSASAISGLTVAANSFFHTRMRQIKTNKPPAQIIKISSFVIDNISPNKNPIKSTLTQVINERAISPSAIVEWASNPSKVSDDNL